MVMRVGLSKMLGLFGVLGLLLLCRQTSASVVNTGRGLPHTKAAYTMLQGHMTATGNLRFWGGKSDYQKGTEDFETRIWVARALANVTYGFSQHGEVSLSPIIYQDAHKEEGEQVPWDTFLNLKMGNYKIEKQPYWLGFDIGMRFPTGKKHNVIFEEYTAGKFEFGITGLLTYRYTSPQLKNDVRVHANLGYWNHNDKNQQLSEVEPKELGYVKRTSQSIRYALGMEFPVRQLTYGLELYGMSWLTQPPVGAASRENYFYMNVSGLFQAHHRIAIFMNADLRLSPGKNTTQGFEPAFPGTPSYPGWRINVGLRYLIMPTSDYGIAKTMIERQQRNKTKELYSQLKEELEKRKQADEELERLKREKEAKLTSSSSERN